MSNEATNLPATWTHQRECREKIKLMEFWWDWVDSGRSFEELKIMVDIHAAAGGISERLREVSHEALDLIKLALAEGADRNEAMTYLKERALAQTESSSHSPLNQGAQKLKKRKNNEDP
jgi:hypothetical protein